MGASSKDHFLELFLANQHRIYRFIATAVPRCVETEDLFQQTSLTLWQRRDEFDPEGDFFRWGCGIAMNHLRNHVRKKQNQQRIFRDEVLEQLAAHQVAHQSLFDDLQAALAQCLEKLPPEHRRLVERCYGTESSLKVIAEAEGRTPNSLYKVLGRIRETLYDCITETVSREQTE